MPVASSLNYYPEPERQRAVGAAPPKLGGVPLTNEECRLRWPRLLFADEARLIAARSDETAQKLLLQDAFVDPWIAAALPHNPAGPAEVLAFLAENVTYLPEGPAPPRPTYQQRRSATDLDPTRDGGTLLSAFVSLVHGLIKRGYFARRLTHDMVDRAPSSAEGAIDLLSRDLGWRLSSWPLASIKLTVGPPKSPWDQTPSEPTEDDYLFDLIEILDRYVARPRTIEPWEDDFGNEVGSTYVDFNPAVGRAVYRHEVNGLLERATVPLRLADDGEGAGLLVSTTDEARTALLQTMASRSHPSTGDRVRHAISLFRARSATEDNKRSACAALALVLEERRPLLKEHLVKKDEGALFQIANEFAIRHEDGKQLGDYRPGFRDWIFWLYLATVELTDRLLSDQSGTTAP